MTNSWTQEYGDQVNHGEHMNFLGNFEYQELVARHRDKIPGGSAVPRNISYPEVDAHSFGANSDDSILVGAPSTGSRSRHSSHTGRLGGGYAPDNREPGFFCIYPDCDTSILPRSIWINHINEHLREKPHPPKYPCWCGDADISRPTSWAMLLHHETSPGHNQNGYILSKSILWGFLGLKPPGVSSPSQYQPNPGPTDHDLRAFGIWHKQVESQYEEGPVFTRAPDGPYYQLTQTSSRGLPHRDRRVQKDGPR